jgi:hypothetical protein
MSGLVKNSDGPGLRFQVQIPYSRLTTEILIIRLHGFDLLGSWNPNTNESVLYQASAARVNYSPMRERMFILQTVR